ncbi:MAG TPA: hypothetical protein VH374_26415 [Polyangia bacterium]|jgi:hypothetical protein|nr:hypothetical protein [Polyangia bacterium]
MADIEAIISSSGGISAGAPFAQFGVLAVQQVSPPVAFTQRMAFLSDPMESIIAPGLQGSAHSFIMGEGTTDSANGDRTLAIGYQLQQNSDGVAHQADDQVLLGNRITIPLASPNSQGAIAVGSLITFVVAAGHSSFGGTVAIGSGLSIQAKNTTDAINSVAIGTGIVLQGSDCVAIGTAATTTDDQAIAIGRTATANTQAVAIGGGAQGGQHAVAIGGNAPKAGDNGVTVGYGATNSGETFSVAIGESAGSTSGAENICIGSLAQIPSPFGISNTLLIGGRAPHGVTTFVWGQGYNDSTGGVTFTMRTTELFFGAGNNLPGNSFVIAAGAGTGNWPNTQNLGIDLQVGVAVASGSNQQTYTSALAIRHSDRNVALWGGLAAPFSGAVGALFIANATTPPTPAALAGGGILSVQGGNLHFLNSAGVDTALTPAAGGGGNISGTLTATRVPVASGVNAIADSGLTLTAAELGPVTDNAVALGDGTHSFTTLFTAAITGRSGTPNLLINSPAAAGVVQLASAGTVVLNVSSNGSSVLPQSDGLTIFGDRTIPKRFKSIALTGLSTLQIDNGTTAAAAGVLTLTNAPTGKSGNPTKYLTILVDNTSVVIPCW